MKQNEVRDLYQEAVAWLATCSASCIASDTLERRFQIGGLQAEALAEQLQAAGVLSPPLPPFNQRRNLRRKRKVRAA